MHLTTLIALLIAPQTVEVGNPKITGDGLHGYISFRHEPLPEKGGFTAGMGFYAAVWSLANEPLANFQIGLPSCWIQPDNSDNKDKPLAPIGTLARQWKERGPTWSTVFQTIEGGLGYWAGNNFRYGPPKFSLNATPQCYDYEIGSPGWSFFYSESALPDNQLGIAQLSNRVLIPPDGLPFAGKPNGEFLGYTWMALPLTEPEPGTPPTGDQSWTCFLAAANFNGPIAYYIPETWSKIGKLFNEPFLFGRGLDSRPGIMGGGAMEINTVPRIDSADSNDVTYTKIPQLTFPVDSEGNARLVQDVTYYSKSALYDAVYAWRENKGSCSGAFGSKGAFRPKLIAQPTTYRQAGRQIADVDKLLRTKIFEGNVWGIEWSDQESESPGKFPQYFKHVGGEQIPVSSRNVPPSTSLQGAKFVLAPKGQPYTSPRSGAWTKPGASTGPFSAELADGSIVTYRWYRFVDQPSFQQYDWSAQKREKLQELVEKIHKSWGPKQKYMPPPSHGKLVSLDNGILVTPPKGLEVGYVPIAIGQRAR